MNIIAMDLGKFNSMFCFNDTSTQDYGTAPVATDRKYLESVFRSRKPDLVAVESVCYPRARV